MKLDKIIGKGAQATVYAYDGCALKVFNQGKKMSEVLREARINSLINELGLNSPVLYEVIRIDGAGAIKMELIHGKSLFDHMFESPENIEPMLFHMVKEQIKINSKEFSFSCKQKERIEMRIKYCKQISDERKSEVLSRLKALPDDNKLCHGDFHGYNIIMNEEKSWIIDWVDASSGSPAGDACRSYLILRIHCPDIAELYLQLYSDESGIDKTDILKWLVPIAAARIMENVPGEVEILFNILECNLSSK